MPHNNNVGFILSNYKFYITPFLASSCNDESVSSVLVHVCHQMQLDKQPFSNASACRVKSYMSLEISHVRT